jgi:cytochrome c oxidase subunit 3
MFTIASIVMLFVSFTTLFVARRGAGRFDPVSGDFKSDWIPVSLPMKVLLINTAVLLLSSLLVEIARRAARSESILVPVSSIPGVRAIRQTSLMWVWATALTGFGFLFGQYRAWELLHLHGSFLNSGPASTFFFLLTGTHALHLAAGLVVLMYACLAAGPRLSLERRCITLDITAWYWHFMAVMWIYVLLALKLMD